MFLFYPIFVFGAINGLVINEVQIDSIDGAGGASDDFIELYNPTDLDIYLGDYQGSYLRLVKRTKTGTSDIDIKSWNGDTEAKVPAHGYYLWANSSYMGINTTPDTTTTGTVSPDNGIALRLGPKDTGLIIDSLGWGDCQNKFVEGNAATVLPGGQSIERQPTGHDSDNNAVDFFIRDTPTPQNSGGQEIQIEESIDTDVEDDVFKPATDYPPAADAGPDIIALTGQEIIFDGSQSTDPDWDNLTYFWNFGDGAASIEEKPVHIYDFPGQYVVSLSVEDDKFTDIDMAIVNVYSQSVIISELLPNQWIELYNQSGYIANLTGWRLNDFVLLDNTFIGPNQFLVLSLPISSNQIQFFRPDGSLASQIDYSGNNGVAFDGQEYFRTEVPTPGLINIIGSRPIVNSEPVIQKSQSPPETSVKNLSQSQIFAALQNPEPAQPAEAVEKSENPLIIQTAALGQSARSSQKADLILILSIIISSSLFLSWGLILLKKRIL